jgi:uncharacterized protein
VKILIGLIVIIAVIWLVRASRKDTTLTEKSSALNRQPDSPTAQDKPTRMLQCHHCGLHIPVLDAVKGRQGSYCTEAHRLLAEN